MSRHALVIDDNAKNVNVLTRLLDLEQVGHTELTNPMQLPALLSQLSQVDVVFLDLEMPGRSGYDVLHTLKSDPRFKDTPIVAYTVHISEINIAAQQGFHSFLGKPLDSDRFPGQLARILNGEHVWETA